MNKKELLFSVTKKDLDITYFCAPGPGGQNKNKSKAACRIKHRDSGATGVCTEHKSALQNKKEAFVRMAKSFEFKKWHQLKTKEILTGKTIEQVVNGLMMEENLLVEIRDRETGKWIKE